MPQDERDYDAIKAALVRGEEELIPSEVVYALLDGANPVKVWRNYREMEQQEVAEKAGISVPYLSQLERGKQKGSVDVLNALAKALGVSLDDLVAG
jgi:DNA-binding XRE family transcriptional regulator